jgi:hypothetical protein
MALARIFSRHPEHTRDLAEQLQQHGYTVEVLSPEEAPPSPADLEIQLETCDPASVLRRAGELAAGLDADIAVATGALHPEPLASEAAAGRSLPEEQWARAAVPLVANAPSETEPLVPAAVAETTHVAGPKESETEAVPTCSSLPTGARAFGATLAAGIAATGKLFASARDQFRESWELARIRNAKACALREQRLLELTRQRAEAQKRALELASERRDMAAYLLQLQREVPHAFLDVRRQWPSAQDAAPATEPPSRAWRLKIRRIHLRKWEAVFAGLLSAIALFVIGLAVASFHSRPAQSATRGATVQTGGVTLQGPQPKSASLERPSPALRKTTQKSAAARARQSPRRLQQRNQDLDANDVVVRHFPAPKPTPRTQADGWKHFSDMDN